MDSKVLDQYFSGFSYFTLKRVLNDRGFIIEFVTIFLVTILHTDDGDIIRRTPDQARM